MGIPKGHPPGAGFKGSRVVGLRGPWTAAAAWYLLKESESLRRGVVIASAVDPRILGMSKTWAADFLLQDGTDTVGIKQNRTLTV